MTAEKEVGKAAKIEEPREEAEMAARIEDESAEEEELTAAMVAAVAEVAAVPAAAVPAAACT